MPRRGAYFYRMMDKHEQKLDVQGLELHVSCTCGQWHESRLIEPGKTPSEVRALLEQAHQAHITEADTEP